MIFSSNDELGFLNYFEIAKNISSGNAKNKLKISSEKGKTYFSLFSNEMILISKIDKYEKDSDIIIDVDDFYSVIKNVPSQQVLSIEDNTLKFGETKYKFSAHPIVLPDYKEYLETLSSTSPTSTINLNLNNSFAIALDFVGDRDTSCVEYVNNHFVATNKVKACLLNDVELQSHEHLIFSPVLCNFLQKAKLKQVSIDVYRNDEIEVPYYVVTIGDTYIISPIPNQKLPNLFDAKYVSMYTHSSKLEVNKNDILDALKRMKIVTRFDSDSKGIEFFVEGDKLILKANTNEQSASAIETILINADESLNGFYTRFNSEYLATIISYVSSDIVKIFLSNKKEFMVAKVTDMDENNIFLLTRLHTNK